MRIKAIVRRSVLGLSLALCATISPSWAEDSSSMTNAIDQAVANAARSDKDRAVDDRRKPADVLRFFDIKPGMQVLDVFAGGGYYTEILSYLVGEEGGVTLYNNQPWADFVEKVVTPRLADNRLPNVTQLVVAPEVLGEHPERYDAAIFILGIHDAYYADLENGWPLIDRPAFLQGIFNVLKDGAVFGLIDANAEKGADNAVVGKDLHRVDPQVVLNDVLAAGFVLEAQSPVLLNPDDDKATSVFLPENRYNTDRSVMKFRKPATK